MLGSSKIECPLCGNLLGIKTGNKISIRRYKSGKAENLSYESIPQSGITQYKVKCECGGGAIFVSIHENITIDDEINSGKTIDSPRGKPHMLWHWGFRARLRGR